MKSYYFQHDYNASNDVKMLLLRQQLGMEGVGIFWYLIEQLAQAGGRLPIKVIPVLANQMQVTPDKAAAVIRNYDLFIIENDDFFSARLMKQISYRSDLTKKRSLAAAKRWDMPLPHGEEFKQAWQDWVQFRDEIKKPITPTAMKLQLKKLASLTESEAVATIYKSIESRWQGLFPEKKKPNLDLKNEITKIYSTNK